MWYQGWRDQIWGRLEANGEPWDILIIGGGITGAGILREASRLGLKALLVEQRDFAWGTSSRSSKLVHGGFRYLKEGKILLTRASVLEREQLMHEGPGLIDALGFLMTLYKGDFPGRWTMRVGLTVYDLLALRWDHKFYSPEDFAMLAPHVSREELECGLRYGDAQTDDARLVLRVIQEAVADGGTAVNYSEVETLLRYPETAEGTRPVSGARLRDVESGRSLDVRARVVVNATGAWADRLRGKLEMKPRIRPLRGSHLIFPAWRVPVAQAISLWHPVDKRPVFIFPWEGTTLIGTTDVDHYTDLDEEPRISPDEAAYLMAAVEAQFPSLNVTLDDVMSTFAGVRPVIGSGKANPSQESRDHVVWEEEGLLTVTGGKLTTFRLIALDVLKAVRHRLPEIPQPDSRLPVLNPVDIGLLGDAAYDSESGRRAAQRLDRNAKQRLVGRYGAKAPALLMAARPDELKSVPGAQVLWAELRWAARAEGVVHLDDLMLRRVRLGLLLPEGGKAILPEVRAICQAELGWEDARWEAEEAEYLALWRSYYSPPDAAITPNWKAMLEEARTRRMAARPARRRKIIGSSLIATLLLGAVMWVGVIFLRRRKARRSG